FTPPPPAVMPSPVCDGLGMNEDNCCLSGCGPRWCRPGCFDRDGCSDRPRFWVGAEYLAWWQRSQGVPPLVTSSPAGTATINSGVLGLGTTTIVYDRVPENVHSGGRFTAGTWCPHFCNLGFEVGFLF